MSAFEGLTHSRDSVEIATMYSKVELAKTSCKEGFKPGPYEFLTAWTLIPLDNHWCRTNRRLHHSVKAARIELSCT